MKQVEPKQTLSITIPISLYQKLQQEVGKGKISQFIKNLVEKELSEEEEKLAQAYKKCYANNPQLLEEVKLWERAGIETWLKRERGFYNRTKSTKKTSKSTSK